MNASFVVSTVKLGFEYISSSFETSETRFLRDVVDSHKSRVSQPQESKETPRLRSALRS